MPDLQNFTTARTTPGQVNCPRWTIAGKLVEGTSVIADFTGANAFAFPDVLATLSVQQQDAVKDAVAQLVIGLKAGQPIPGG